jgi:hypothetical protein
LVGESALEAGLVHLVFSELVADLAGMLVGRVIVVGGWICLLLMLEVVKKPLHNSLALSFPSPVPFSIFAHNIANKTNNPTKLTCPLTTHPLNQQIFQLIYINIKLIEKS